VKDAKISSTVRAQGLAYLRSVGNKGGSGVSQEDLRELYRRTPSFWGGPAIGHAVPLFDADAHKDRLEDGNFFKS